MMLLFWTDHYLLASEMHAAHELSNFEMTDFVADERPWLVCTLPCILDRNLAFSFGSYVVPLQQSLPQKEEMDFVRDTYAKGKSAQSPRCH